MASVMGSYIVGMWNYLYKKSLFLQILNQLLTAVVSIHTGVFSGVLGHGGIIVDNYDFL